MPVWSIISNSEEQTLELGRKLGRLLVQPALILLQGDLGAGKSVFARGIARGLGVPEDVPITSPTFTLMNHYPAGRLSESPGLDLYHFDLYRISDPDELYEIGFDEYAHGNGVALVEWPERLENDQIVGLWIRLKHQGTDSREISFHTESASLLPVLAAMQKCFV